ncbi:MAG: cardiolipin synthase ClsB [Burkholderiaceae bacterium]|nr:cardiolipin synthase ClsB [Burkholderiaceae bacterium]
MDRPLAPAPSPDDPAGSERGAWPDAWGWYLVARPVFSGGNEVELLRGGQELFPAMVAAIRRARHEVWLATYIFHDDASVAPLLKALRAAARRGVRVRMVVDGFGTHHHLEALLRQLQDSGVALAVFRPLERWTHWLQPGQLRRLHMKLCSVDGEVGFVGGINLIDDHIDLHHGTSERPRLDFAVRLRGPVVRPMEQAARAMWSRAWFGRDWRAEARQILQARRPWRELRSLWSRLRLPRRAAGTALRSLPPVQCAFVVRDNLRQRRTIERAYIQAIDSARSTLTIVSPYFYPGADFRRALVNAAQRGVQVQLLLQGKVDYRLAALAARVLYGELMRGGVQIHEYTPAFLHAKVMVVDGRWATVGSSNIDPLSLLLNLESNVIVQDDAFAARLNAEVALAIAQSRQVQPEEVRQQQGWPGLLRRALVAWAAHVYLRLAGVTGRY